MRIDRTNIQTLICHLKNCSKYLTIFKVYKLLAICLVPKKKMTYNILYVIHSSMFKI